MKVLLIDDLRSFKSEISSRFDASIVIVARNSVEGLNVLKNSVEPYSAIFLDHDLGVVENVGIDSIMPVVDYMCEQAYNGSPVNVETVYVHTSNPVGAKNIVSALERYGYKCVKVNASDYFVV